MEGQGQSRPWNQTSEFQPSSLDYKLSFLRHGPFLVCLKGIKNISQPGLFLDAVLQMTSEAGT